MRWFLRSLVFFLMVLAWVMRSLPALSAEMSWSEAMKEVDFGQGREEHEQKYGFTWHCVRDEGEPNWQGWVRVVASGNVHGTPYIIWHQVSSTRTGFLPTSAPPYGNGLAPEYKESMWKAAYPDLADKKPAGVGDDGWISESGGRLSVCRGPFRLEVHVTVGKQWSADPPTWDQAPDTSSGISDPEWQKMCREYKEAYDARGKVALEVGRAIINKWAAWYDLPLGRGTWVRGLHFPDLKPYMPGPGEVPEGLKPRTEGAQPRFENDGTENSVTGVIWYYLPVKGQEENKTPRILYEILLKGWGLSEWQAADWPVVSAQETVARVCKKWGKAEPVTLPGADEAFRGVRPSTMNIGNKQVEVIEEDLIFRSGNIIGLVYGYDTTTITPGPVPNTETIAASIAAKLGGGSASAVEVPKERAVRLLKIVCRDDQGNEVTRIRADGSRIISLLASLTENGQPVPNAEIKIEGLDDSLLYNINDPKAALRRVIDTDDKGIARLRFAVGQFDYGPKGSFDQSPPSDKTLKFRLSHSYGDNTAKGEFSLSCLPMQRLTVHVRRIDGKPAPGARIQMQWPARKEETGRRPWLAALPFEQYVFADENGNFTVPYPDGDRVRAYFDGKVEGDRAFLPHLVTAKCPGQIYILWGVDFDTIVQDLKANFRKYFGDAGLDEKYLDLLTRLPIQLVSSGDTQTVPESSWLKTKLPGFDQVGRIDISMPASAEGALAFEEDMGHELGHWLSYNLLDPGKSLPATSASGSQGHNVWVPMPDQQNAFEEGLAQFISLSYLDTVERPSENAQMTPMYGFTQSQSVAGLDVGKGERCEGCIGAFLYNYYKGEGLTPAQSLKDFVSTVTTARTASGAPVRTIEEFIAAKKNSMTPEQKAKLDATAWDYRVGPRPVENSEGTQQ